MNIFFITGTDTDCGKTYVTCQLLDFFRRQGKTAYALKPVASGLSDQQNTLISEDVFQLKQYNAQAGGLVHYPLNRWQFASPISPHLAAAEAGYRLSVTDIIDFCQNEQLMTLDYLLIEGAGGLMAPLNEKETWLDFLIAFNIPVILVVGMKLGCLNHALLSDAVLKQHQISEGGWIANCLHADMLALRENIQTLQERMSIPLISEISYQGKINAITLK